MTVLVQCALDPQGLQRDWLFKGKINTFNFSEPSWKLQAHLHDKYLLSTYSTEVIEI